MTIIDTNVYISRWPFRRVWGDEPANLIAKLRERGVKQAWTGNFDGLLHRDMAGVNIRLAETCRKFGGGMLIPFGSINPKLPDWQEDVRRCHEVHKMPGIRLHPNYHGYTLDDPAFAELLSLATSRNLLVQMALEMEDDRTQSPLMRVAPVDVAPLGDLVKRMQSPLMRIAPAPLEDMVKRAPGLRLSLVNCNVHNGRKYFSAMMSTGAVYMDIAMQERVGGLGRLNLPLDRVTFGSYYPFFEFESAVMKVQESGLDEKTEAAICAGNARRLMGATAT